MKENKTNSALTHSVVIEPPTEPNGRWTVFVQTGDEKCPFTFGEKTFQSQAWAERYAATMERVFVSKPVAAAPAVPVKVAA
jgi:hypothetical protein